MSQIFTSIYEALSEINQGDLDIALHDKDSKEFIMIFSDGRPIGKSTIRAILEICDEYEAELQFLAYGSLRITKEKTK